MTALFSITLFISAVLLFWVQLMVGKLLLPFLGGSPAVWNTCLFFFQGLLLLGYSYAHWMNRFTVRQQAIAHSLLLIAPLAVLPIHFEGLEPNTAHPILSLLRYLVVGVGLPFFVVSTTAPLMQRWFAAVDKDKGQDPYFLYAASNLGSMIGLLGYPLGIEPRLAIATQTQAWTWGYGVLAICTLGCALSVWWFALPSVQTEPVPNVAEPSPPTLRQQAQWMIWAAVPASLLLGTTTYITTDLAAVPLLWAIPLLIYLLTFVLSFAQHPLLPYRVLVILQPLLVVALCLAFLLRLVQPIALWLPLHLLGLFIVSAVFHGQLARSRPHPAYLTRFYWWIALGGALGGWLNAIAAPILFPTVLEYPLMLVLSLFLLFTPELADTQVGFLRLRSSLLLSVGLLLGGVIVGIGSVPASTWGLLVAIALSLGISSAMNWRWWITGLTIVALVLLNQFSVGLQAGLLASDRSFFGVYRVVQTREQGGFHNLLHGTTLHGKQSLDPTRRDEPLTYFTRSGPVGQLFAALGSHTIDQVGVLGLGVGTLATYAQPGQHWTFYEIDPLALQLATNPDYFTFLRDADAPIKFVVGDGRLAIAQSPNQHYDLLFMDAFSSDSIPVHLITQEAIQLYFEKLKPDGLLVINITNRFLDLESVLGAIAQQLHLVALTQWEQEVPEIDRVMGKAPSHWVVMARTSDLLAPLQRDSRWQAIAPSDQAVWTDDYSNPLQAVRLHPRSPAH